MGQPSRRGTRIVALAAAATVLSPFAVPASAAPVPKLDESKKTYIVQMVDDPVATYEGGTAGLPSTAPAKGEKVQATSEKAKSYSRHLRKEQRDALREARVPEAAKKQEFTVALNGFTAQLTQSEALRLKKTSGVLNVWEDEIRYADTVTTPDYLGLTGKKGVWAEQFGKPAIKNTKGKKPSAEEAGIANAGKGMVVAVLDTGIDPNNPSFAPMAGATVPAGYTCDKGDDPAFSCNNKIVGARFYGTAYGNDVSHDFNSPRDTNGHGSHTAGTAAGNHGVDMSIMGTTMGDGSGMAPAAQIAVYKGLWQTADGRGSGSSSGLVAAINDAVADGVDVINYSVSGSRTYVVTADELAFMAAARAGVFVSTSAGNEGDVEGPSSVAHNSPWTMTVAASSHPRGAAKTVTLGNGQTYAGVGVEPTVGPAPLVTAESIALPGVPAASARQCFLDADNNAANGNQPTLDPSKAAGKIVICQRGVVDRVQKSLTVKTAGGIGMIQYNATDAQSLNADFHSVPSIHVNATSGNAIVAYATSDPYAKATISGPDTRPVDAPSMAGFSSYGPASAGGGDLLKPDITAPGVDIVAAYSQDPTTKAPRFNSISGTSMSAPHIAGLAALLKQKHPSWSPMAIKSAMMTTARQTTDQGKPIQWSEGDATPLNFGSGEVVPGPSYNPGLVYDSHVVDWYTYACAIKQLQLVGGASLCEQLPAKDASDLNYPSISIGQLAGSQTVTRTVTNVGDRVMTYRAKVEAPRGTRVEVTPNKITVGPGGTATFKVSITRTNAALGTYTFGSLTWVPKKKGVAVRSPIAVKPVPVAAPEEVTGKVSAGSVAIPVTPGFSGMLNSDVDGLVPGQRNNVQVTKKDATPLDGYFFFDVTAGTTLTRVATYSNEVKAEDIDLNLYRFNAATGGITEVGSSGNGDSTEDVTMKLEPGTYVAAIDLFSAEASVVAPVHVFNLTDASEGNMTVSPSPAPVTSGTPVTLTASWTGLDPNTRYLGRVNLLNGTVAGASTLVSVAP